MVEYGIQLIESFRRYTGEYPLPLLSLRLRISFCHCRISAGEISASTLSLKGKDVRLDNLFLGQIGIQLNLRLDVAHIDVYEIVSKPI